MRFLRFLSIAFVCVWPTLASSAPAAPTIWVVDLEGAVGPASVDLVIRTLDDAVEEDAAALVIRMNTPGGLAGGSTAAGA